MPPRSSRRPTRRSPPASSPPRWACRCRSRRRPPPACVRSTCSPRRGCAAARRCTYRGLAPLCFRATEFLLPDGDDGRELIAARLDLRAGPVTRTRATYYDTFDGRLHADGGSLRHAGGRLVLLDRESGEELASGDGRAPTRLFAADLPKPLRARLGRVLKMRALLPVAKLRSRRTLLAVLNGDAK